MGMTKTLCSFCVQYIGDVHRMSGYDDMMAAFYYHFLDIGICPYKSSIPFKIPSNFERKPYNVEHKFPAPLSEPYAVVLSTGMCEVERQLQMEKFKKHIPSLVQFVYESCIGPINGSEAESSSRQRNRNLFFYKLEEAMDTYGLLEHLSEANEYVQGTVIPSLNAQMGPSAPPITVLDTYHVTQTWKTYRTLADGRLENPIHFYSGYNYLELYTGNMASITVMKMCLSKITYMMEQNLLREDEREKLPPSVYTVNYHNSTLFPPFNALPTIISHSTSLYEGKLLYAPNTRYREIWFVNEGIILYLNHR